MSWIDRPAPELANLMMATPPSAAKLENDGGSSSCDEFVLIEADKTNQEPNTTRGNVL